MDIRRFAPLQGSRRYLHDRTTESVALVLLDTDMPVMSGLETIPLIRGRFPKLPIVLMSGEMETISTGPKISRLAKPFQLHELLNIISDKICAG